MEILFDSVEVGSGLGAAVPSLSLTVGTGVPCVVAVETDERPLLVSMLLGGRLEPDAGRILVDGRHDTNQLRRRTALVDTPFVAEPPAGISLASVVAEEFSFSDHSTSASAVRDFLGRHGIADYAKLPIRALPPVDRVRLFSELALLRHGVDALIVTSPERHGAEPQGWYSELAHIAERGITVAIVTDVATRDLLIQLGAQDAYAASENTFEKTSEDTPESTSESTQS